MPIICPAKKVTNSLSILQIKHLIPCMHVMVNIFEFMIIRALNNKKKKR